MTQSMRLPDSWVESLLNRMAAIYGEKFLNLWSRTPPADMRDMWADALGRFDGEQIKWALHHLIANNPFPPTLPEFVMLCRQAPRPEVPALPAPVVPKEVAKARAAELESAAKRVASKKSDGRGWAREILANPRQFPHISVKFAREALGITECAASAEG